MVIVYLVFLFWHSSVFVKETAASTPSIQNLFKADGCLGVHCWDTDGLAGDVYFFGNECLATTEENSDTVQAENTCFCK